MVKGRLIYQGIQKVRDDIKELEVALAYLEAIEGSYPHRVLKNTLDEKWDLLIDFEEREFEEQKPIK